MKNVIWKYPLLLTAVQDIEMPVGSILLSMQIQKEIPCLWVLVYNENAEKETIRIRTIGTGVPIDYNDFEVKDFLGTYQLQGGNFVFHVFQVTK